MSLAIDLVQLASGAAHIWHPGQRTQAVCGPCMVTFAGRFHAGPNSSTIHWQENNLEKLKRTRATPTPRRLSNQTVHVPTPMCKTCRSPYACAAHQRRACGHGRRKLFAGMQRSKVEASDGTARPPLGRCTIAHHCKLNWRCHGLPRRAWEPRCSSLKQRTYRTRARPHARRLRWIGST